MLPISKFKLNRKKKINILFKDLKYFISSNASDKINVNYFKKLSQLLGYPLEVIEKEYQIFLFNNFENQNGRFSKKLGLIFLIFDFFKSILLYFFLIFFSRKHKEKIRCDLAVDDLDNFNTELRFKELEKYLKTICIHHGIKKKRKGYFIFENYKNTSEEILFIKHFSIFYNLSLSTLFYSLRTSNNLFLFLLKIMKIVSKYETIFNQIKSDFLIQERHYNTSALKNFIFKKYGGKYCCVTQKNIFQINGPGMYVNSDIFFSLGKKTGEEVKKYAGNVKKIIPIGSLAMELNYFKRKEKNNLPTYDLIVFASDHNKIFHSGYDNYYHDYLAHYKWIKKLAEEHKNILIGIKLKKIITDKNVINIFKDLKNVNFLFDRKYASDSYFYAAKAKALCTWSSTLAFEFLGHGRVVYFCDPNNKNISFLPNKKFIKMFKLNNYKSFKKKILGQIKNKKIRYFNNKKISENFCIQSRNVSKKIFASLKTLK